MTGNASDLTAALLLIGRYRHLISHLDKRSRKNNKARALTSQEAAILARLWMMEDLAEEPLKQSQVGLDLRIAGPTISKKLTALSVANLVVLLPGATTDRRDKCYQITESGKEELNRWLQSRYSPPGYSTIIQKIQPDSTKMLEMAEALKEQIRQLLD